MPINKGILSVAYPASWVYSRENPSSKVSKSFSYVELEKEKRTNHLSSTRPRGHRASGCRGGQQKVKGRKRVRR